MGCALLANSFNPSVGPVLGGVDVVSYFSLPAQTPQTNDKPLMGTQFSSKYGTYTFLFYSKTNKAKFDASPEKYIPMYGGYCSKSMACEYKEADPLNPLSVGGFVWDANCLGATASRDCWAIINGKLHLFFDNAARKIFFSDIPSCLTLANNRWSYFNLIWNINEDENTGNLISFSKNSPVFSVFSFPVQKETFVN